MERTEGKRERFLPPDLESGEKYHAFISHSSEDSEFSRTFVQMLENHGLVCLHYERDFLPGTSILVNVERGICESRRTILLVTQNFVDSDWAIYEAQASLVKSIEKKIRVVIPVLHEVDINTVPTFLKEIHCLEYDRDDFWNRLLKAIRDDVPLSAAIPAGNVAHGLAWSYHYGFLNLVLPGLGDRIQAWEVEKNATLSVFRKMVIILPETCRCPDELDQNFTFIDHIHHVTSRAGNKDRDYKSSIYEVKDPDSDKKYRFLAEFATPLLSLYEMEEGEIAGMDQHQKIHQRMLFQEKLREILNHPCNKKCHNKAIYLTYKDKGDNPDVLSRVVVQRIEKEMARDMMLENHTV